MKLLQLQYFQAVCKYNNITKAAESLNVSQPSVTMSIKELESELGVNLFHRSANKKLTLSQEGHYFLSRIGSLLNEVDLITEEMRDLGGRRNRIKLGLPIQVGAFFLPLLLNQFHIVNPEIKLEVVECDSSTIMDLLLKEQIDMSISAADFDDLNIETAVLYQTEVCFCVHRSHPLAGLDTVDLETAAKAPLVLLENHFFTSQKMQEQFRMKGLNLDVRLYTSQLHTIKNLVCNAGLGTFLLSDAVYYDDMIIPVPLKEPVIVSVGMATKKGRQIYQDSQKMMRFILNEYNIRNPRISRIKL